MNIQVPQKGEASLPILDMEFLRTFVAISDLGNFSRAAKKVHRTPSAVSMQIKKLEEVLNCSLFMRDARSVTLTQEGELLLGYARRILMMNNEVLSKLLVPEMNGTVRLGSPEDYGSRLLPIILQKFSETHPHVAVDVIIDSTQSLLDRMETGELDVTLITTALDRPIEANEQIVLEEPLVWVGKKGGCAYQRNPVPVSMWDQGCVWRDLAVKSLQEMGKPYRIAYKSAYTLAQKSAILADLAIAVSPKSFLEPPLVMLGDEFGQADLGRYQIRLKTQPNLNPVGKAVRDHVISCFDVFQSGDIECLAAR